MVWLRAFLCPMPGHLDADRGDSLLYVGVWKPYDEGDVSEGATNRLFDSRCSQQAPGVHGSRTRASGVAHGEPRYPTSFRCSPYSTRVGRFHRGIEAFHRQRLWIIRSSHFEGLRPTRDRLLPSAKLQKGYRYRPRRIETRLQDAVQHILHQGPGAQRIVGKTHIFIVGTSGRSSSSSPSTVP